MNLLTYLLKPFEWASDRLDGLMSRGFVTHGPFLPSTADSGSVYGAELRDHAIGFRSKGVYLYSNLDPARRR